jgi:hypothetical protein
MVVYISKENIKELEKTGQAIIKDENGNIDYIEIED